MSRSSGIPSRPGGTTRDVRDRIHRGLVALVTLGVVLGLAGLFAVAVSGSPSAAAPSISSGILPAATHGDLVVPAGSTYTIEPTNASTSSFTYFQGGNVTVDGTLIVKDATLSFVQTPINYVFQDAGTVKLYNSVITTDVQIIPFTPQTPKLNLAVTGVFTAWNSTLAFPGTFTASGAGATVTLNGSTVQRNSAVLSLNEPKSILGDTEWAPTISVSGGAHLNLFGSTITNLYGDNWAANGLPAAAPPASVFNITVSGSGSELSAVDSSIGVNWSTYNVSRPWNSSKLIFSSGAVGYLANITTPTSYLWSVTGTASAVQPDATSHVYFYRWAEFTSMGRNGVLGVRGAQVSAYYAYGSSQANNATVNSLNNLATTDPAIWGYVQYWDAQQGASGYGVSNALGQAWLLLASSRLDGTNLPGGYFLGNYHIGITVATNSVGTNWFNWSVTPYPQGVASGTAGYNGPDVGPTQSFQNYYSAVSFSSVFTANGTADVNQTIREGQLLGIAVTATDNGSAPIAQVGGTLFYNSSTSTLLASYSTSGLYLTTPGQSVQFNLTWVVNDTVTGLHGPFTHSFLVNLEWNQGIVSQGGGVQSSSLPVHIEPSQIRVVSVTGPASVVQKQTYLTTGTIQYNGSSAATVDIFASGGGQVTLLDSVHATPGSSFALYWSTTNFAAGTTYTVYVTATYNGVTSAQKKVGVYSIPAKPVSVTSFFTQKVLGLPFWVWLAIAVAIVIGIVAFLLVVRRQSAGKLVECGECGNLIPETATVCPKCGAEFEKDLVRCSRCASTIPAESKYCPECAAQLLGKPGEGGEEAERQSYGDFTEKFRAEAKRELGENYSEGGFWDWWKRQPTYTAYGQWKLQQSQGTPRTGMAAPPAGNAYPPEQPGQPPRGGGGAARAPPAAMPPPTATAAPPPAPPAAAVPGANLKACPNCGKEIPPDYLVCPFCGAVTQ